MFLSYLGFLAALFVLYKLLSFCVVRLIYRFYDFEERMTGKRFVVRTDDGEMNQVMSDGLAAFAPGKKHLLAGAVAGVAIIVAVPVLHFLYSVWVRFLMLFTDPMSYGTRVFHTSLQQIVGYLPRIGINLVALAFMGMCYAKMRRRYLQENRTRRILFWEFSAVEVFATVLGWLLYLAAALLPRQDAKGWYNFAGMLTMGGGWLWVFSGFLVSIYMRTAQNAVLWTLFRYRWQDAIPAVVRMMTMYRLGMPHSVVDEVTVNEAEGTVSIQAHIDPIDAERLHDSLLAIPGLRHPQITALGVPPGFPVRIAPELAPRMRPLPPRTYRRPEGPPKGYGAEFDLLDPAEEREEAPQEKARAENSDRDAT